MANNTITCPVCGYVMNSFVEFCPTCGYEIHLLPDNAPKAVIDREEHRAQAARNLRDEKEKLNQELAAKQSEITNLNEQIATISAQAEQAKDEAVRQAQAQTNVKEPVAYLIVKNKGDIVDIYNLDEGEHTFGYLVNEGTLPVLYGDMEARHFSIKVIVSVNERGRKSATFMVTPRDGQVCGAPNGANVITGENNMDQYYGKEVYVGDVSFKIIENKNFK